MIWPELTTVRRPISNMAREAVRLLIEQVRAKRAGAVPPVKHTMLDFTLVKRESTGAAPKRKSKT
jgi:LacI family transcriptional regulator